jgi:hypothetical protein
MKNNFAFIILLLCPAFLAAQFQDSFDDGELSSNPSWFGDISSFKVNTNLQLQLNETSEGDALLNTDVVAHQNMEWQFWVKMGFSPSDNNFCKVYLLSDNQDFNASLNGYYLKLGESGSGDALELFRQSGGESVSICRGSAGVIASSFAIRIRVIHDSTGRWTLMADLSGGNEFTVQDTCSDINLISGNWLGVYCKYTSSNAGKFYFDDFYAGEIQKDTIAPELVAATALNSNTLKLKFSEDLLSNNLNTFSHFSVDNGIGYPVVVERDPYDHSLVLMAFSVPFTEDSAYHITVSGLEDLNGNLMISVTMSFFWHTPHAFDLLINEIMVDPDPAIGLPPFEYVELHNRSSFDCNLTGWSIKIGAYTRDFPATTISSGNYVLLCDDNVAEEFSLYGSVIAFSSLSLSNSGTSIVLLSAEKKIIHAINYDSRWYKDDFKDDGGWSLEMIDANNPCGSISNWQASEDMKGGTPGKVNSVCRNNPDVLPPIISGIGVPDGFHVILGFSESIDSATLVNPSSYGILMPIESIQAVGPLYQDVILTLREEITPGVVYDLTLNGGFCDCSGNCITAGTTIKYAYPVIAGEGDIVINEVLFNPALNCGDFIELFNRSDKVVDLKPLMICQYDSVSGNINDAAELHSSSSLLFPQAFVVLTGDSTELKQCHPNTESKAILEVPGLPAMSNDGAEIALALLNGMIIDWVAVGEELHYPLLNSFEGVSLERIHPDRGSRDLTNWHSAAESAGFATPTKQNSQFGQTGNVDGDIQLNPEIFSPDNDGYHDNLMIAYNFPEQGYNATVQVYNSQGVLVRQLITNELCGTTGFWSWDGTDDRHKKAGIGQYIIYIQVFDLNGHIRKFKKVAVLGGHI